jgi:voltage-gated potassium channel
VPDTIAERWERRQRAVVRDEVGLFIRRFTIVVSALVVLFVAGAIGFALAEGTSLAYGAAWTLDTISTVGAMPAPHDTGGRILKAVLELLGIGTLFYGLVTAVEFFVSGELSGVLEERRTQRAIDAHRDHFIVCGFGRVGRQVARDLQASGARLVVIDPNPQNHDAAREMGLAYIESDAGDDDVLKAAGIERARGVIACVDSDAENIFITLTARGLRPDILIVARAAVEESEKKLVRAGADRVISPYKSSGTEMARFALHPQVGGALQVADLRMEEIEVCSNCSGAGKSIDEVRGRSVIVALRRGDGALEAQPSPETVVRPGDLLVALGSPDAVAAVESLFQPAGS